jgi:hypothetical protein
MKNILYITSLLFSFESLDKKIKYHLGVDSFILGDFCKFKTFSLLRKDSSSHKATFLLSSDIKIIEKKDNILLKSLHLISFKSRFCHNSKNKSVSNYFKFFFFLSRQNVGLATSSYNLFEDDIYLETLAINNLYNVYHIEQLNHSK